MSEAQRQQFLEVKLRLSDRILATIEYACLVRDLETAQDLVGVLERLANRRPRRFGGDRRAPIVSQIEAAQDLVEQARRH